MSTNTLLKNRHNVIPGMFLIYSRTRLVFADLVFNGYGNAKKDFMKQVCCVFKLAIYSVLSSPVFHVACSIFSALNLHQFLVEYNIADRVHFYFCHRAPCSTREMDIITRILYFCLHVMPHVQSYNDCGLILRYYCLFFGDMVILHCP